MTQGPLRWGILGTGNIAGQFAAGLAGARRSILRAVASRSAASAAAFAAAHRAPAAHASYQQLLDDPAVDAVYISLPNSLHHEWTLRALASGKHVLCEKPLAVTAAQAAEMFAAADRAGRLLVEAFMYRSHPLTAAVVEKVRSGAIGKVKLIRTSFCFHTSNLANIRFDPGLAGGGLMDVGCYCVDFSRLIAGAEPVAMHAAAHRHETGVDDLAVGVLHFPDGVIASFTCGMRVQAGNQASICGDGGYIEIPVPWKPPMHRAEYALAYSAVPKMDRPGPATLPAREVIYVDADRPLYALEADALADAVFDRAPPAVSRGDSIANLRVLEQLRAQISGSVL